MKQAVGSIEGIKYGFKLLGYFLVVGVVGGVITLIGSSTMGASTGGLAEEPNVLGVLFGFGVTVVGIAIIYAGILGTGYKVIADAVYLGNSMAEQEASSPTGGRGGHQSGQQARQKSVQQQQTARQRNQRSQQHQTRQGQGGGGGDNQRQGGQ